MLACLSERGLRWCKQPSNVLPSLVAKIYCVCANGSAHVGLRRLAPWLYYPDATNPSFGGSSQHQGSGWLTNWLFTHHKTGIEKSLDLQKIGNLLTAAVWFDVLILDRATFA